MRRCVLWASPVLIFAVLELHTGSSAQPPLAPDFNRVYESGSSLGPRDLRELHVTTWNIDHGAQIEEISDAMRTHRADLYLLQEVDWNTDRAGKRNVAADLAGRLEINSAFAIEFQELSQAHGNPAYTGQATLARLPIVRSRVLRFRRQSGFWKPHAWIPSSMPLMQRRVSGRIALISEFDWDGNQLVVYNAHLESRSAGFIQEKQLDEILSDAAQYPAKTTILLGGDLNTKYLPSIFLHKLEAAGFRSAMGERIERTHRIMMALDWIFAKGPVHIEGGAIEHDARGSDHYPLCGVIRRSP